MKKKIMDIRRPSVIVVFRLFWGEGDREFAHGVAPFLTTNPHMGKEYRRATQKLPIKCEKRRRSSSELRGALNKTYYEYHIRYECRPTIANVTLSSPLALCVA